MAASPAVLRAGDNELDNHSGTLPSRNPVCEVFAPEALNAENEKYIYAGVTGTPLVMEDVSTIEESSSNASSSEAIPRQAPRHPDTTPVKIVEDGDCEKRNSRHEFSSYLFLGGLLAYYYARLSFMLGYHSCI